MPINASYPIRNTLGTASTATYGVDAASIDEVVEAQRYARQQGIPFVALGEGSNVIAHAHVDQLVCRLCLKGIDLVSQDDQQVTFRVAAGENWHELVQYCLAQGWFGLENLSLIPGSVGAAPVQNIGAYGVELADFVAGVQVLDASGNAVDLSPKQCEFAYRDSLFKRDRSLVIVALTLTLQKQQTTNLSYPELRSYIERHHDSLAKVNPLQVAQAVIALRSAKLPDPEVVPNAGSFFKNPVVSADQADQLAQQWPQLNRFEVTGGFKLSAAQLIDLAGWKRQSHAGVTCWEHQALVITNTSGAPASDVLEFTEAIRHDISQRYAVTLEYEPYELS